MLERVAHWLFGWVEMEISGNGPRFLNIAARSGLEFWGFLREGDRLVVRGKSGQYKKLRPLARRCGARPRLRKRGGFPFLIKKVWKQRGLVVGALCGAGLYFWLSGACWGVTVSGAQTLTLSQVLAAARENGLYPGARLSELDPKGVGVAIQNDLSGVAWLSVNTEGCFVEISLREGLSSPQVTDDREWSNIVASREGTVVSIQAERGRPVVELGETVQAGQMLIAGLYVQEVDPYSPPPEDPYQVLGAARGSVQALTYREFTVTVPREQTQIVPSGKTVTLRSMSLFGLRLPLGWASAPQGECRVWRRSQSWAPLGVELPLSFETVSWEPLEEESVTLSQEEWEQAALRQLRRVQREELPAGSKVVEEELTYSYEEGVCTLRAACRCQEEIGVVRPILVE